MSEPKKLVPIGYRDEAGKYRSYEDVHGVDPLPLPLTYDVPKWLFDWALKQVEGHHRVEGQG